MCSSFIPDQIIYFDLYDDYLLSMLYIKDEKMLINMSEFKFNSIYSIW